MDIYDIEFVFFQEFIFDDAFWKRKHFIFFDFAAKTDSTEVTLNDEAQDYAWVSLDEVFDLVMDEYTRRANEEYIFKKRRKNKVVLNQKLFKLRRYIQF